MAAPSGCRNRTPVPSRGPEPCSPPLPLQNGSTKGLEQEAEAPALCLRLLCPQILVPALIGKVRARPAAALAGAACLPLLPPVSPVLHRPVWHPTNAATAAALPQKGDNIKRIRRESGATVSVADAVAGCEERVVHITGER